MLLADTSVWIQHFRQGGPLLAKCLSDGLVMMHPFILGELACGNLNDRKQVLSNLNSLPKAILSSNAEVLQLLDDHKLWGRGLGWIDAHLLASALLSHCGLWTLDKRLEDAATKVGLTDV